MTDYVAAVGKRDRYTGGCGKAKNGLHNGSILTREAQQGTMAENGGGFTGAALKTHQFTHIAQRLYELCGINLKDGKEELVKARLQKRLRVLGMSGFDEYIAMLDTPAGAGEVVTMVDLLTTNTTSFYREPEHFTFLAQQVLKPLAGVRKLRLWSAGCSTGAEPYTLAIHLHESLPDLGQWDVRILATDISTRVLDKAKAGVYSPEEVADVAPPLRTKYFTRTEDDDFAVGQEARRLISFARLNLMEEWPMRGPFDAIFCRNVMIYFDKPTQEKLVERYRRLLTPQGYLFVGHSESLTGITHGYRYAAPAVYRNAGGA